MKDKAEIETTLEGTATGQEGMHGASRTTPIRRAVLVYVVLLIWIEWTRLSW